MLKQSALGLGLCIHACCYFGFATGSSRVRAEDTGYAALVRDGLAEYRAGRYLESRVLFTQAHNSKPSARTLRGMGQAAFGALLYGQAVVDLGAALEATLNPLTEEMRREVEQTIDRARRYTGRFTIELDPPDSEVKVDGGRPVFDSDGKLLLDVGQRQVIVRAKGRVERSAVLQVEGGEDSHLDLSVSLDAAPPAERAADAPDAAPLVKEVMSNIRLEPQPAGPPPPATDARLFPWLAAGSFGLAAASAGVGFWQLYVHNSRITSWNAARCNQMWNEPGCRLLKANWKEAATWEAVAFGLAGAFAVTGAVLLLLDADRESESPSALSCGPAGVIGVSCRALF